MALSSQITVSIKAIVEGLPQVKELTNSLQGLKRSGITANLFAGIERAVPSLGGLSAGFASLGKNAQNAGYKLKVVNSETEKGNKAVLTFSESTKKASRSFLGLSASMKESSASLGPLTIAGKGFASVLITVGKALAIVTAALSAIGAGAAGFAFEQLIQTGFEFNKMLETTKVSVSAILNTAGKIFKGDQLLTGVDAIQAGLAIAEDSLDRLRKSSAALGISFSGVVRAFQEGLGPGLQQAGLSLEQLEQLIPKIAAAAQTIGLPVDQFAQEVRALFSGDIDKEARVANLLRIKPETLAAFRGDVQGLFDFLNEKLQGFAAAGPVVAQTFAGVFNLLADQVDRAAGAATKGFFEEITQGGVFAFQSIVDKVSGEFTPALRTLIHIVDAELTDLASNINKAIQFAINLVNELAGDTDSLTVIIGSIRGIITGIYKFLVLVVGGITEGNTRAQQFASIFKVAYEVFKKILLASAVLIDVWRILKTAIQAVLSLMAGGLGAILKPLGFFSSTIDDAANSLLSFAGSMFKAVEAGGGLFDTIGKTKGIIADLDKQVAATTVNVSQNAKKLSGNLKFVATPVDPKKEKEKKGRQPSETFAEPASERELRAARFALLKAEANAERIIQAATLDQRQALFDSFQSENLISLKAYYAAREEIIRANADNEIAAINDQLDELQNTEIEAAKELSDNIGRIRRDPKEQNKEIAINNAIIGFQTEQARIQANIAQLEARRVTINTQLATAIALNTSEANKSLQAFEERLIAIQSQLAQSRGDPVGAFAARRFELEKQIIELKAQGDFKAAGALQQQLDLEQLNVELEQQSLKLAEQQLAVQIREQEIRNQVTAGKITEQQGNQQVLDLHKEKNAELIKTLEIMKQIAIAAGKVKEALEIDKQIKELQGGMKQLSEVAQRINQVFEQAFTSLFDSFIDGTKSAKEAFRDFARDILAGIAKIIAQMLIMQLIKSIFGASGPGGLLGKVLGFAEGGPVHGPGTGKSDSIFARLSTGEYVINAKAVRLFGTDFLDQINSGSMRKFADGGLVQGTAGGIVGDPSVVVRNVNVFDPRTLFDAMSTPRGEKLFLNFVTRNRQQMRSILG